MARTTKSSLGSRRQATNRKWVKTYFSRRLRRTIRKEIASFDPNGDLLSTRKDLCDPWEFD